MRILVADDDAALRELLAELLTDEGHETTAVATPGAALGLARERSWDLFLVDTLGQADRGFSEECRGFVRSLSEHAPVILCTAHSWATHLEAREVGAAAIIRKPFDIDALIESVRRVDPA